jgi:hypothetical protein
VSNRVAGNGLGIADGGELELQMLKQAQKMNRITQSENIGSSPNIANAMLGVVFYRNY